MLKLCNGILGVEKVPSSWGGGLIVPIHKSGDKQDPNNYRGITLSNGISKLFNKIMNSRLVSFLEDGQLLSKEQICFRRGARTSDHIFVLKTIIDFHKQRRQTLYSCFIDLRKAFDSVWRAGVFYKLLKSGLSTKFVSIVRDLYDKTNNRVLVNGFVTNTFISHVGTRQGCNLSPTIFNMYLNDLPVLLRNKNCQSVQLGSTNINLLMYADDIILLSKTKSGLQRSLDVCNIYFEKWKLQVNAKKTKVMIFNKLGSDTDIFYYGDGQLEITKTYKYLGLQISETGSLKAAVSDLLLKAKKAYAALYRSLNIYDGARPRIILKAFDAMVVPILLYGSEVWAPYILKHSVHYLLSNMTSKTENFHTRVCKNTLGMKKYSSNIACRSELGRYSFSLLAITNTYRYYLRLQQMPVGSLLGQATLVQKSFLISKQKNIFSFIQTICKDLKFPLASKQSYKELNKCKLDGMAKNIKKLLMQTYSMIQNTMIKNTAKLELLSNIKSCIKYEKYLDVINNTEHRKAITKLRISGHDLPIEKGRALKIPRHERHCKLCPSNNVGGEFHVLMECTNIKLQAFRDEVLDKITNIIPQFRMLPMKEKFIYVLSCCDMSCTRIVAPYISRCLAVG